VAKNNGIKFFWIFFYSGFVSSLLADGWPEWRGPRGDGTWDGPSVSKFLPENGLRRIWKTKISPGYSGVTVKNGLVYLMDRPANKASEGMERVICLDAYTGSEIWKFSYSAPYSDMGYGKGPRASITIKNGRAFGFGARGMAFALDARTGKKLWMRDLVEEENATLPIWGFSSSPVTHENTVIYHAGCQPTGSLIALLQQNGETQWRTGSDDMAGYSPPLILSSSEITQLICWGPNRIMSLPVGGGKAFWEIPYKVKYGVSITKPIVHHGIVMVSGYWHGTRAVSLGEKASEAKLLWSDEKNLRGLMSQALCRNGVCYLLDRSYGLTAFDIKTGKIFWRDNHQITSQDRNPHASLVWSQSDGDAFALNADGELVYLNLGKEGFKEYWREQITAKTWAHPAFVQDRLYARDDQSVVCFQLPTN
jgi:outer membrane protein assembly factor BamB